MIPNRVISVQKLNQLQCILLWENNFFCSKQVYQNSLNIFILTETMMLLVSCQNNNILIFCQIKNVLAPGIYVYKFQFPFHAQKKNMKTVWKIHDLILCPFRTTKRSILLFIERIVLSTRSTGTVSNVLFTSVENDSKFSWIMASSKAS